MLEFIEKEPWIDNDVFTGQCLMFPNMMIKNGEELFIINRRFPQPEYKNDEIRRIIVQLKSNGGQYARFYGFYENPLEMLAEMIERRHSFDNTDNLFSGIDRGDPRIVDFCGNRNEVAAAFMYRIYDMRLADKIRKITGHIIREEWSEAEHEIYMRQAV